MGVDKVSPMVVQVLSLLADKAPSLLSHAPAPARTLVNTNLVITLAVAAAEKPASQFRFQQ